MIGVFRYGSTPARRAFARKLENPARVQRDLARDLIDRAARTRYGEHFGLKSGMDLDAFRARVPIITYEELEPWIQDQLDTTQAVLTPDRILFYEKTSGSSGTAKLFPYTAALRSSFNRMFWLWAGDTLRHDSRIKTGRAWISVSLSGSERDQTPLGLPIGSSNETDYLNPVSKRLAGRFLVQTRAKSPARTVAEHLDQWVDAVLNAPDLELISCWSPTFLHRVMDRAEELHGSIDWKMTWPKLKLVSAWSDAQARSSFDRLKTRLPHARFQPKGLLATEGPLSFPWNAAGGAIPLIDEVLYEFADSSGRVRLLHELTWGEEYSLIISQKAGLSRYQIGDRVRVHETHTGTPRLEFLGRETGTSDLVGEKLNERWVQKSIDSLDAAKEHFFLVLPVPSFHQAPHYLVVSDHPEIEKLAPRLDQLMKKSHHYAYARELGQLGPIQAQVHPDPEVLWLNYWQARGMKLGDIKGRCLVSDPKSAADLVRLYRAPEAESDRELKSRLSTLRSGQSAESSVLL